MRYRVKATTKINKVSGGKTRPASGSHSGNPSGIKNSYTAEIERIYESQEKQVKKRIFWGLETER